MKNTIDRICLLHEIKVHYRQKNKAKIKINECSKAIDLGREIYALNNCQMQLKEYFFLVFLNRNNLVIGYYLLSTGGIAGTVADIRIAFATALKCVSSSMILYHNHPSGNNHPSEADIKLTKRFKEAGALLEVPIIDHIILTQDSYYSFEENGLL